MSKYSAKIHIQLLAETLIQSGIEDVIISPGSRNGGLIMQFVNDKRFDCYSIVDERCAAFVALGMAQQSGKPVVVSCTSGSAAANYYPAVTEAFYQNIPLIVLTADRPENYTDLFDGQTIRQKNLFEKHSYHNVQLTEDTSDTAITDNFMKIKEAIRASLLHSGPVHINMPFSEPLYNSTDEKRIVFDKISVPDREEEKIDWHLLEDEYYASKKVMILVGLQKPNSAFQELMKEVSDFQNIIILTETTSNLHHPDFVSQIDAVLRNMDKEEVMDFQPDLLITLGQNVISKKIKQFLRQNPPRFHWHVDQHWHPDTYFALTQSIKSDIHDFIYGFLNEFVALDSDYKQTWLKKDTQNTISQTAFMKEIPWCDLYAYQELIAHFPENYVVQYSNSAVIRYSQLFKHHVSNSVYCNRGTSGIDGSTSTAIGFAMKSKTPVVLVTGDMSFFYDSNALWNNYIPSDFRIILVNNGGGDIFKIIPGPDTTNAMEKFFEARHHLTAEYLAQMYGFEYIKAENKNDLQHLWSKFYAPSEKPKILEIQTQKASNAEVLKRFIEV